MESQYSIKDMFHWTMFAAVLLATAKAMVGVYGPTSDPAAVTVLNALVLSMFCMFFAVGRPRAGAWLGLALGVAFIFVASWR